jgi:hypothetical protein
MKEKETINFLVFNARNRLAFDKYLNDFKQIVLSYENEYSHLTLISKKEADQLDLQAKKQASTPDGKKYEKTVFRAIGQEVANFMRACTSYVKKEELTNFNLFVRIDSNGNASESLLYPKDALSICFSGLMRGINYPPHKFDAFFLLNIDMQIGP